MEKVTAKVWITWFASTALVIASAVAYAFTTFETKDEAKEIRDNVKEIKETVQDLYRFELSKRNR